MSRATAENKRGALMSPLITFFSVVGIILLGIIFWVLFKAFLKSNGAGITLEAHHTAVDIAMENMLTEPIPVEKDGIKRNIPYGELIALGAENKEWKDIMKKEVENSYELDIGRLVTGDASSWGMKILTEDGDELMRKGHFPGGGLGYSKTGVYTRYHIPTLKGNIVSLRYYILEYHFQDIPVGPR